MRSAILFSTAARWATGVAAQPALAAWAASSARLMSSSVERATWQNTRPVTGVTLSKYWPRTGEAHSPLMKLS